MSDNDKLSSFILVIGSVIIAGAVIGVFALIGQFHWTVITAAFAGAFVTVVNQLTLVIFVNRAFDKAVKARGTGELSEEQIKEFTDGSMKKMNNAVKLSYAIRLPILGIAVLCVFIFKTVFNPIAFVAALVATHLLIMFSGLIQKKARKAKK